MSTSDYCCTVWGKGNQDGINEIVNIQVSAACIVLRKSYRKPSSSHFKELKWLPLQCSCKYHAAILDFKSINNQTPSYIWINQSSPQKTNTSFALQLGKKISQLTPRKSYLKDTSITLVEMSGMIRDTLREKSTVQFFSLEMSVKDIVAEAVCFMS
jgi:hypothetical protein